MIIFLFTFQAGIFCLTRAEWMLFVHGCVTQSMTVATVYANLGEEGLAYAVNEVGDMDTV